MCNPLSKNLQFCYNACIISQAVHHITQVLLSISHPVSRKGASFPMTVNQSQSHHRHLLLFDLSLSPRLPLLFLRPSLFFYFLLPPLSSFSLLSLPFFSKLAYFLCRRRRRHFDFFFHDERKKRKASKAVLLGALLYCILVLKVTFQSCGFLCLAKRH